jgi:hypothetical protein
MVRQILDQIGEALGGIRHTLRKGSARRPGKFIVLIPETRQECTKNSALCN